MENQKVKLSLKVLVTDQEVAVLGTDPERDSINDKIRECIFYGGASAVEIRTVEFEIELLPPAARVEVDPKVTLQISEDVRAMVEANFKERQISDREKAWDTLMRSLSPGLYRIYHDEHSRGISKEK